MYSFIDAGQGAVNANYQSTVRAHITQAVGERIEMPQWDDAKPESVHKATDKMVEALLAINQDPSIKYTALVTMPITALSGTSHTADATGYDIGNVEPGNLWVFVAPNKIKLCDTINGTAANRYPAINTASVVTPSNKLGNITGEADVAGGPCDNNTSATINGEAADVRIGRAIFVGGVTDSGSQFCVKYTQANAKLDSNGFAYWHLRETPEGVTIPDYGTGNAANLKGLQADCGVHWVLGELLGVAHTTYHPAVVTPKLCASNSPRGNPETFTC